MLWTHAWKYIERPTKAVNQLKEAGYSVERVVTIVDREEGGAEAMEAAGLQLMSLFRLSEIAARAAELAQ